MVAISLAAAAFALTSVVMAMPAPSASATDVPGEAPPTIFVSKEEARELAKANFEAVQARDVTDLEARQIPSFGRFCEHWDFAGACYYHRFEIDNRGHYIGDEWNDRISSVEGYDNDKKCTYFPHWDPEFGGYCYGVGFIVPGRTAFPRLASGDNDVVSCYQCSWR